MVSIFFGLYFGRVFGIKFTKNIFSKNVFTKNVFTKMSFTYWLVMINPLH